jgi:hypothetical protein
MKTHDDIVSLVLSKLLLLSFLSMWILIELTK